jgi:hypothetical protein
LASALARVLSDRTLAAQLGASGRQSAMQRFDATRQVRLITGVYERVLAGRVSATSTAA